MVNLTECSMKALFGKIIVPRGSCKYDFADRILVQVKCGHGFVLNVKYLAGSELLNRFHILMFQHTNA